MPKNTQELSKTRRDDADEMALALGFQSTRDPSKGSHQAMLTYMLTGWRKGEYTAIQRGGDVRNVLARPIAAQPSPQLDAEAGERVSRIVGVCLVCGKHGGHRKGCPYFS